MNATINLTRDCNMNCSYCFEKQKRQEHLSLNNLIKIYNYINRNKRSNEINLVYFGGEPLLNIDVLYEGHQYFKSMCERNKINYAVNLMTNGTIYNDTVENFLKSDDKIELNISWDGLNSSRQKSEMVLDNIKAISLYRRMTVSLTIDSHHIDNLEENIDYMATILPSNVDLWINLVVDDRDWTREKIDLFSEKFLRVLIKHRDRLNFEKYDSYFLSEINKTGYIKLSKTCNNIAFDVNGDIYTCTGFLFLDEPKTKLGNINTHFDNIEFCNAYCSHNFEEEYGCTNCDISNICHGKCHFRYTAFTKEEFKGYLCYLYQSYNKAIKLYLNKYLKSDSN